VRPLNPAILHASSMSHGVLLSARRERYQTKPGFLSDTAHAKPCCSSPIHSLTLGWKLNICPVLNACS
jgi:hypothetical protein